MARVMLFGAFQDLAGWDQRDCPAGTIGDLKGQLSDAVPALGERLDHASTLVILNHALMPQSSDRDATPLDANDEVAFGPPVSGG